MTGRHSMLAGDPGCLVDFHGCGRHYRYPTAASACGDGLKIVWTSEVASTGHLAHLSWRNSTNEVGTDATNGDTDTNGSFAVSVGQSLVVPRRAVYLIV